MDTPRTDKKSAFVVSSYNDFAGEMMVSADFSRQLERENQELRAALEAMVEVAELTLGMGFMPAYREDMDGPLPKARAVLAKVRK